MQNQVHLSGRIELNAIVVSEFKGTCGPTFIEMQNCYLDINQCGGATPDVNETAQGIVRDLFDAYIQAGVMTSTDISKIKSVSFQVLYQ